MRAPEVLDHKADLMVRLEDPIVRRIWAGQIAMDSRDAFEFRRGEANTRYAAQSEKEFQSTGAANIYALWHVAPEAECFHVTPDLAQLVLYSASQLDEHDRIDRTILPTRSGIARFEGGLPFTDVRGKKLRISWIGWGPVMANFVSEGRSLHDTGEPQEVTALWLWNDHREEPDEIYDEMRVQFAKNWDEHERHLGRWGFIGSEIMMDGASLGPAWVDPGEFKKERIVLDGDVPVEFTNAIRLAHAFFLLLGQTVSQTMEAHLDKPRRKRAGRAGIPARVTVVQLRNLQTRQEQGESMVEWSHRWLVRGFWRWQVCGPEHRLAQEVSPGKWRARIWIAPFVKGPADKPLVVSDKVYALHR